MKAINPGGRAAAKTCEGLGIFVKLPEGVSEVWEVFHPHTLRPDVCVCGGGGGGAQAVDRGFGSEVEVPAPDEAGSCRDSQSQGGELITNESFLPCRIIGQVDAGQVQGVTSPLGWKG